MLAKGQPIYIVPDTENEIIATYEQNYQDDMISSLPKHYISFT